MSVLVAAGILGIILAGFASILADQSKNQAFIEQKMMVTEHHMEVRDYLRIPANCTASFLGQNPVKTDQGVVNDLKKTLLDGSIAPYAATGSGNNRGFEIVGFELSDADPDVSVTGEGTTHFITQYKTNSGREVFRVVKLYVTLDASNLIQSCSILAQNAAGNSNIPGLTPQGACIVRRYNFGRAVGSGADSGNDDEPRVLPTALMSNGKGREKDIYCPKNFPLAMTGSVSPACNAGNIFDSIRFSQDGLASGVRCNMRFLQDRSDLTPTQINNAMNGCPGGPSASRNGACHITCCNL